VRLFTPFLNVGSLQHRPPRASCVTQDVNVDMCRPFPPNLGGMGTRVNVVVFDYTATTGGLETFGVVSNVFKFAFLTVKR
jgi:hypothetical protein